MVVIGLALLWVSPRIGRLALLSPIGEDAQSRLAEQRIEVDTPTLASIPGALLTATGPEGAATIVSESGGQESDLHLLNTRVAATNLYPAWSGLAYVSAFWIDDPARWVILIVSAQNGDLILRVTSVVSEQTLGTRISTEIATTAQP